MTTKILAVSGQKNSGKTTLIQNLLPKLIENGLRVCVIKHDGHSFLPDVPGTDTFRFLKAGALGTAVYDGEKFMLVRCACVNAAELCLFFPDADLILIEGLKNEPLPKVLISQGFAFCSFSPQVFSRDDTTAIAGLILQYAEKDFR